MVVDPLLTEVGWSWLTDALDRYGADYTAPSGTVTAVSSRAFGAMSADPPRAEVEIRLLDAALIASAEDVTRHLMSWSELLCTTAGLPPLPEGVVVMSARRRR